MFSQDRGIVSYACARYNVRLYAVSDGLNDNLLKKRTF